MKRSSQCIYLRLFISILFFAENFLLKNLSERYNLPESAPSNKKLLNGHYHFSISCSLTVNILLHDYHWNLKFKLSSVLFKII